MDNNTDNLLKGIQNKRIEAFEELYEIFFERLVLFAQVYVYEQDVAEDFVQEIILELWATNTSHKIQKSLEAYLYKAIKNKCLNHLRKINIRDSYKRKKEEAFKYSQNHNLADNKDLINKLHLSIEKLPPKCKQVFLLCVIQNYSYSEIAEDLGISINTIKNHIKRAYKYLREQHAQNLMLYILIITYLQLP